MKKTNMFLAACLLAAPVFAEKLPPLPDGAFTYVVIPDTQRYHGEGAHVKPGRKPLVPITGPTRNPAFESRVDWTVRNLEKERIFFVSHTGDIVDFRNDQQWSFASNLMTRFEGKVPYGVSPGNHDLANFSSDDFNRYFPRSRYEGRPWYAGGFDGYERDVGDGKRKRVSWGNADSCQLAEIDGHRFVFFHLECNAPAPVLKWVDAMLDRYADRTAIVCTHMFVGYRTREIDKARRKGASFPDEWFGVMDWSKCHGDEGVSGTEAWRTCFAKHRNLLLVVSGDQSPAICWRETLTGENGNVVHAVLQDYPRTRDDEDWIRLYRFLPKENRIDVWTYSPQRDEVCHDSGFRKGRGHHVFSLPMSGTSVSAPKQAPAAKGVAWEVPAFSPAQEAFLKMSPAERRAKFTDEDFRRQILQKKWDELKWRPAAPGETSRWRHLPGIPNMRDVGGLRGLDGRMVRTGLIYRSGGFNGNPKYRMVDDPEKPGKQKREYYGRGSVRLSAAALQFQKENFGIRTDLDLRSDGECREMTGSPLGPQTKWVHSPSRPYASFHSKEGRAASKRNFAVFLDEANYPIGIHCIGGADRTGSLVYLLQALLGVSDADLLLDWEITAISTANTAFAHAERYDKLVAGFARYPGATTRERAEGYVKALGFTDDDIARFRKLLLK